MRWKITVSGLAIVATVSAVTLSARYGRMDAGTDAVLTDSSTAHRTSRRPGL